ncbi:hypothetical protein I633_05000 [Alteromonas mediterranea 615]|uniref:Uncharacterized protein n=1 Tax=Alteromonas mediterranea 615 TaxID=1300253 RepID=S5ABT2_9ALTE|nr:hypothetical protein I633_05000 [Alteromonas mediterranea 615]
MNIAAELAAGSKAHNTATNPLTGGIQVTICYNRDHIKAVEINNPARLPLPACSGKNRLIGYWR